MERCFSASNAPKSLLASMGGLSEIEVATRMDIALSVSAVRLPLR